MSRCVSLGTLGCVGEDRLEAVDVCFELIHNFLMLLSEIVELHLDVGQRVRHALEETQANFGFGTTDKTYLAMAEHMYLNWHSNTDLPRSDDTHALTLE